MPWLKIGDNAAMYPALLDVADFDGFDDRLINELFGFLVRLATESAGHVTDYVVSRGQALAIAGASRINQLVAAAEFCGLMTPMVLGDGRRAWRIAEDPDFIHMRLAEELEWERQRKKDNSNPALTIPVRVRDGDACRYCGRVVQWSARRGGLAGTYDHRVPGQPATVDTYVVACRSCNASRKDNPDADKLLPLLPVPSPVYYSKSTVEWVNTHPWAVEHGIKISRGSKLGTPSGEVAPGHRQHVQQPAMMNVVAADELSGNENACGGAPTTAAPTTDVSSVPVEPAAGADSPYPSTAEFFAGPAVESQGPPPEWAVADVLPTEGGDEPPAPEPVAADAACAVHHASAPEPVVAADAVSARRASADVVWGDPFSSIDFTEEELRQIHPEPGKQPAPVVSVAPSPAAVPAPEPVAADAACAVHHASAPVAEAAVSAPPISAPPVGEPDAPPVGEPVGGVVGGHRGADAMGTESAQPGDDKTPESGAEIVGGSEPTKNTFYKTNGSFLGSDLQRNRSAEICRSDPDPIQIVRVQNLDRSGRDGTGREWTGRKNKKISLQPPQPLAQKIIKSVRGLVCAALKK